MKTIGYSMICVVFMMPLAGTAQPARDALADGAREFERGAFEKASAHFEEAATRAPGQKLDPAVAHYNQGNALYRMQDFAGADQAYQNALRTTDLDLAPDGYYNRGNALAAQALQFEQQQQLKESIGLLDQALAMYEKSMLLNPGQSSAKANYELVAIKKKELELQQQEQQEQQQNQDQPKEEQKNDQQKEPQDQKQEDQQQQQQQEQPSKEEEQKESQPQPKPSNKMTEEEAEMMLDAMKNNEQNQREQIQMILGHPQPVDKDW